ncbi:hypothetical protein [Thermodesulfovibrio yellowstonii]|jgi:hypothetical protein|uniref:Uncharacterized protein n=1 Tax=Thermodesulfovibrio yellowstonii (strain ATCC 51303 / DSM 11347 / YP87) TaxID=289376 RepID=B5YIK1_THEYD|nr:hypothetical protein [Thermodesulfovibrio yellowstonii]ACI21267.1 hypothetical protein THEYE_A0312 [Thermodesulfovibrio yellowstonii DSM 11347]
MKKAFKDMYADLKEMWTDTLRPVLKGFLTYAPGKTLAAVLLTGFNLSSFFKDFGLGYALTVLVSFVGSIYLFLKAYQRTKEGMIQEEKERIEKLCQTVDFHLRKEQRNE